MPDDGVTPEQIAEYAQTPQKVVGDEGSVEERRAGDFIALDRYAQEKQVTGPPHGMRISVVRPRGTV